MSTARPRSRKSAAPDAVQNAPQNPQLLDCARSIVRGAPSVQCPQQQAEGWGWFDRRAFSMVDGRGTGSLVSLTGRGSARTHTLTRSHTHTHTDQTDDRTALTEQIAPVSATHGHMATLQGVHAVAGLTPRTAYLSHTQDAAPSPRTGPNVRARLLSGSHVATFPPD